MTTSTLLWILGIGAFFYLMRKSGGGCCGGHNHEENKPHEDHGSHGNDTKSESLPKKLEASGNVTVKDPVCSMKVVNPQIVSNHFGRSFYFCSEQCRKIFNLNPNKYVEI